MGTLISRNDMEVIDVTLERKEHEYSRDDWNLLSSVVSMADASVIKKKKTKDDIYCYSLAMTLYYAVSPLTVGMYAPWGRDTDFLLKEVEYYLRELTKKEEDGVNKNGENTTGKDLMEDNQLRGKQEANTSAAACLKYITKKEEEDEVNKNRQNTRKETETPEKPTKITGKDLIKLIFLMIFYHPVITKEHKKQNIHYVFIRFSAWEYAGSNQIWAGLVTTLCDTIESCFGLVPISVYRAVAGKDKIKGAPPKGEWVSKMFLGIPLLIATWLVITIGISVIALIFICGFPTDNLSGDMLAVVEGVLASVVGIWAAGAIKVLIAVIRNVVVTQKAKVERKMNRTDMSSQLGFMSDVKREVKTIISYLKLLEVFQRQKIRVILEITNLDKCMPDKVVGVLNAMNILLSDLNAPFISILVIDPRIIVECVESSHELNGMANNGYQFLNRIITLPFCIPKTDCKTKLVFLDKIIKSNYEIIQHIAEEMSMDSDTENEEDQNLKLQELCSVGSDTKKSAEKEKSNKTLSEKGEATLSLIKEAFKHLSDDSIKDYVTDNVIHIRRVVNSIIITITIMIRFNKKTKIDPKKVAEWVLLATQWPCRLSWILQCIDDEQQRMSIYEQEVYLNSATPLWDVFLKSLKELDAIKPNLKKLLDLDAEPGNFQKLLSKPFTVKDANDFLPYTVNLDYSIKRQMELLRGSNNMWESKETNRLTMPSLLNKSIEEVCEEMGKVGLQEDKLPFYRQKIKEHNLNGKALFYSDNMEIKKALDMGLGDWTLFRVYFLEVLPPSASTPAPTHDYSKPKA
ncbi:NTPase KAP family P-loop domain-containing protein 1-like [Pseudophryne corroboree]|uniref:NTPase KAP family P-loop domain-containing protein 1-like n=1 Tax=Pseudophryne corroboree TaxID=495146 RepID=UPI0030812A3A